MHGQTQEGKRPCRRRVSPRQLLLHARQPATIPERPAHSSHRMSVFCAITAQVLRFSKRYSLIPCTTPVHRVAVFVTTSTWRGQPFLKPLRPRGKKDLQKAFVFLVGVTHPPTTPTPTPGFLTFNFR